MAKERTTITVATEEDVAFITLANPPMNILTRAMMDEISEALTEIVVSIKRVTEIVSEIATASAQQSTGIEEVNKALTQMDEMTQQNSALVEENAATAKTLEQQATAMDERVCFFRLAAGAETAAAPSRPAAPARRPQSTARPAAPSVKAAPKAPARCGRRSLQSRQRRANARRRLRMSAATMPRSPSRASPSGVSVKASSPSVRSPQATSASVSMTPSVPARWS